MRQFFSKAKPINYMKNNAEINNMDGFEKLHNLISN